VLLDEPELVHAIVAAVRRAMPAAMPLSAKMRLGHRDDERMIENAQAIAGAGASELVVHGRTKAHGYRPPAYWDRIARIRAAVGIPVIANGEVWTVDDARRCMAESGCDALMLGRGLVSDPGLALALRGRTQPAWVDLLPLVVRYGQLIAQRVEPRHRGGRIKQWLNMLRRRHPGAQQAYDAVRELSDAEEIQSALIGLAAAVHPVSLAAA
jgi:tRNA-dihydrouridine synthase C